MRSTITRERETKKRSMMKKVICFMICAFISLITDVSGTINRKPSNEATSIGGQAVFNCSSNDTKSIFWTYTTDCNTTGYYQLTDGDCNVNSNYTTHFRTEKQGEFVCNLIVFNASLSHGGCYDCFDGAEAGGQFYAMLVIVDPNATITRNSTDLIPGDVLKITTSVSYKGPVIPSHSSQLTPSFYWTLQSDPSWNITSHQVLPTDRPTSASSYIVVTAQKPAAPPYLCNLFFNPPTNDRTDLASNAPTYVQSSTTQIYDVSYAPENLTISGVPNPCLHQPVVLTCSAFGHPTPTYQWFDLTNNTVLSEGSTVKIDGGGSYECVASNTISDVPYNASINVSISDCAPLICANLRISDPACISLLVIVIFLGLNLICFIVFIVFYGYSGNGRKTLNDRFPWLKKMLPCINGDGCTEFDWIILFAILSIFASILFFPTMIIMAYCCEKNKKTNQGNGDGIHTRQNVYTSTYDNVVKPNIFPEQESYEALQLPTAESTADVYEELTQKKD